MAILVGAQNLLVYKNRKITILSDSQAALKALCNDQVNSKLVLECRETLESLSRFNKVTLAWVPGHNGVTGNENADFLARKGAENTYVGPEPVVGLTEQSLKALPKNWCRDLHRKIWKYLVVPRQSKMFIKTPGLLLGDLNSMTRHQISTLTGLLTGHGHLFKHLNAMGVSESPLCRKCGVEEKDSFHIMCECEALSTLRSNYLNKPFPEKEDIKNLKPREILNFARKTGLFGHL
ncbi:uncharacterized protein LOC126894245 isoform X2 [Daktulosphaira vitifoliae]|nr:uncharacterized protein LOC126894245 isoform X2 [Daktulosphaira vitifoliae]